MHLQTYLLVYAKLHRTDACTTRIPVTQSNTQYDSSKKITQDINNHSKDILAYLVILQTAARKLQPLVGIVNVRCV